MLPKFWMNANESNYFFYYLWLFSKKHFENTVWLWGTGKSVKWGSGLNKSILTLQELYKLLCELVWGD